MDKFEVQVLDGYNNPTYADGSTAGIYRQHPPLVNASLPPGQWQVYDIIFTAPRFETNTAAKPGQPAETGAKLAAVPQFKPRTPISR